MSIYSNAVVRALKAQGLCAIVAGELICQLPNGHAGCHQDGNAQWDYMGSWCKGCELADAPHEHVNGPDGLPRSLGLSILDWSEGVL